MSLSRFFVGIAILTLIIFSTNVAIGNIPEQDYGQLLFESLGSVFGSLFIGAIGWFLVRLVRGHEKSPDGRTMTLYTAAVLVGLLVITTLLT